MVQMKKPCILTTGICYNIPVAKIVKNNKDLGEAQYDDSFGHK